MPVEMYFKVISGAGGEATMSTAGISGRSCSGGRSYPGEMKLCRCSTNGVEESCGLGLNRNPGENGAGGIGDAHCQRPNEALIWRVYTLAAHHFFSLRSVFLPSKANERAGRLSRSKLGPTSSASAGEQYVGNSDLNGDGMMSQDWPVCSFQSHQICLRRRRASERKIGRTRC